MAEVTVLQNWIFSKFVFPFLLIFFIVFAVLEKTKVFGEDNKQLNAMLAFVIGLIFVGVAYPKEVVANMVLFLTVALVVVFVTILIWGFATGGDAKIDNNYVKWAFGGVLVLAVVIALVVFTGFSGPLGEIFDRVVELLFYQSWSTIFWTNILFIVVVAVAIAVVLKNPSS